ncbi:MAG: DUF2330 domain-containing protein [Deltaproteobacteria bacterium]|nr:DUF2330 domain-containing protein [Deltaproteobacteria bacterium]
MKLGITLGATILALAMAAPVADAFCGFYINGSEQKMFNDATNVVLMRQGTRTVLSMQNDFRGPLTDFAMVVPVPVVLKQADVKTLDKGVLDRIDSLGSPRLVEYWEQDPCPAPYDARGYGRSGVDKMSRPSMAEPSADMSRRRDSVKIEAKFEVGEYKILILSATDSSGLERWLTGNGYKIPPGAEPLLRPYVESGSKFFVAKVDPKKVKMDGNRAALSPLRFHYDSEEFSLPIRLGMANADGKQDLIVNILSDKRFELANYKNVVIPTNFDVKNEVRSRFAEFYAALFDKTIEANPGAVVTEYAWTTNPSLKCDPCPPQVPADADAMTLGGDVIGGRIAQGHYVLTRLHARYGKQDMKDDLRFKEAKAITGGREHWGKQGLEYGAQPSTENYFQARYAIRHWWTGAIKCQNPQRGVWGGPPDGRSSTIAAHKVAFAPRGKMQLASVIKRDLWEIGYRRTPPTPDPVKGNFSQPPGSRKVQDFGLGVLGGALGIFLGRMLRSRRKK